MTENLPSLPAPHRPRPWLALLALIVAMISLLLQLWPDPPPAPAPTAAADTDAIARTLEPVILRLATLEDQMRSEQAAPTTPAETYHTPLPPLLVLLRLELQAATGQPLTALGDLANLLPPAAQALLEPLSPFATLPLPTAADLAEQANRLPLPVAAETTPNGLGAQFHQALAKLVTIRRLDQQHDDPRPALAALLRASRWSDAAQSLSRLPDTASYTALANAVTQRQQAEQAIATLARLLSATPDPAPPVPAPPAGLYTPVPDIKGPLP